MTSLAPKAGVLALVILSSACGGSSVADPPSDEDQDRVVLAALETIASVHGATTDVAAGFGQPFIAPFEPNESVARMAESAGLGLCSDVKDCSVMLGRPSMDVANRRAELSYTNSYPVAGVHGVTIWKLVLDLVDGEWVVRSRTQITHFESG